MDKPALTLHEARTYGALAAAVALTASAALGAGADVAYGPVAGLLTGLAAAGTTVYAALATIRVKVTARR